ncbi:MAG: MMPL family transporter [Bacteroidota bacterium]
MKRFAEFVVAHPRFVLATFILLTFAAIFPASTIRTDFDLENFYPKDDPTVVEYNAFLDEFGKDDNVILVGYTNPDLLSKDGLLELKALSDAFEGISNVSEVQSLWTADEIRNENGNLEFEPYLEVSLLDEQLPNLGKKLTSDRFTKGFLISDDLVTTAIYITIDEEVNSYPIRNQVIEDIYSITANYVNRDFRITGIPFFRNQYVNTLNSEVVMYISISSVLIILLLWYLYRSRLGILLPMIIVWLTVLLTVAAITLTGGYLEIMSSTIAPILLCVGIADSIHMISKFDDAAQSGMNRKQSITEMVITLGSATFLTSITTAIGFGTLVTSDVVPMKRFGLYTAVGVLLAYLITIFFLPAILNVTKTNRVFKENGGKLYVLLGDWLIALSRFNERNYRAICVVAFLGVLAIGLGMTQLRVNGYVFDDVSRDSQLIKDSEYFSERLAPPFPMEFIIDTEEEFGITNPEFMSKAQALQDHLLSYPEVRRATSFTSLMQEVHEVMSPEEAAIQPLPNNPDLVAQYILLLEVNGNDALERVTDFNYQQLRISTQTLDAGSERINEIRESVNAYLAQNFPDQQVQVTGSTILSANLVGKMVYSLATSIGLAFVCISIIMAILFRDLKMVVISLIPNMLPLVLIAGAMGMFGIDIKPSTAVIFTIAFGIAVDDTIHYLARLRVEMQRGMSLHHALTVTTQKTGRAIIITSLILLAGFGTLITSEFASTKLMGALVASTVFFAIIADLLVLPALFHWFKPGLKSRAEQVPELPKSDHEAVRKLEFHP